MHGPLFCNYLLILLYQFDFLTTRMSFGMNIRYQHVVDGMAIQKFPYFLI